MQRIRLDKHQAILKSIWIVKRQRFYVVRERASAERQEKVLMYLQLTDRVRLSCM